MKTLLKEGQKVLLNNGRVVAINLVDTKTNTFHYASGFSDFELCISFRDNESFIVSDLYDDHDEFGPDDVIVQTYKHDGTLAAFELLRDVRELPILEK
jgi:hypothetical protein